MEFTNQQKLIIGLLTDIHEKLAIEDSFDADFVRRAVAEDQGWALGWRYPGTFDETNDDPQEVNYVADVLEMWSVLEDSFEALDATQRKQLAEVANPFGRDVRFPGFDGNNEHELLSIAKIFVNDLDRWSEFKGRVNNSHMPTTDRYQRMITEFKAIREQKSRSHDYSLLDVNQLSQVLNSQRSA